MTAKPNAKQLKAVEDTGPGSDDPFTYTTRSGETVTVASLASPFKNAGELRKMRKASSMDLSYYIIERDCDEATLAVFDAMPFDEFRDDFAPQWAEHSGIDTGE